MKKLLEILGTITIASSGIAGIVANSPYQKEESIKNSDISDINYQQTNSTEILKRTKRSNENQLEVWYEFLAHNTLKAKISHETWKTISFKHSILNNQEFKNWLYLYLNEFPKLNKSDAGDWDEMNRTDIETIRNIIADKFNEINNVFINKNNDNLGLLIVTNRASYWKQDNYYGVHVN